MFESKILLLDRNQRQWRRVNLKVSFYLPHQEIYMYTRIKHYYKIIDLYENVKLYCHFQAFKNILDHNIYTCASHIQIFVREGIFLKQSKKSIYLPNYRSHTKSHLIYHTLPYYPLTYKNVDLAWRSSCVMDCHATIRGSIPGGDSVKPELQCPSYGTVNVGAVSK